MFKIDWDEISPYYITGVVCFLVAIGLIFFGMKAEVVHTTKDLMALSGTVNKYSFQDIGMEAKLSGFGRDHIELEEYDNDFFIASEFSELFNKEQFKNTISKGSNLKLKIRHQDKVKLNNKERIPVYALENHNRTFLQPTEAIYEEQFDTQIQKPLVGIVFFLFGLLVFWYGWKISKQRHVDINI